MRMFDVHLCHTKSMVVVHRICSADASVEEVHRTCSFVSMQHPTLFDKLCWFIGQWKLAMGRYSMYGMADWHWPIFLNDCVIIMSWLCKGSYEASFMLAWPHCYLQYTKWRTDRSCRLDMLWHAISLFKELSILNWSLDNYSNNLLTFRLRFHIHKAK